MTTKNKLLSFLIILIVVFLLGFVPQYVERTRLEQQNMASTEAIASLQLTMRIYELQGLAGKALIEVLRQNYGLAGEHTSRYFEALGTLITDVSNPDLKTALEQLAAERDSITASIAQMDPTSSSKLQTLLLDTSGVLEQSR